MEEAFLLLMAWLYRQKGFSPEMLEDEEVREFIKKTAALLDNAVDLSVREVPLDGVSVQRLKESDYVFSGIKTFHELNEAFPSLLDEDGGLKPFERFLNDVQTINDTYNGAYLKTEWNFARSSALMAANGRISRRTGRITTCSTVPPETRGSARATVHWTGSPFPFPAGSGTGISRPTGSDAAARQNRSAKGSIRKAMRGRP